MLIEHKTLGVRYELPELTQGKVESFFKKTRELTGKEDGGLSSPEYVGIVVRAAAFIGWLDGLTPDDVANLSPAATIWLSSQIQRAINEASAIPPE